MAVDPKHLGVDGVGAPPITLATAGVIEGGAAASAFGSLPTLVIAAPSALVTVDAGGDAGAGGFFVVGYADLPRAKPAPVPVEIGVDLPTLTVSAPAACAAVGVALSSSLPVAVRERPTDRWRIRIEARKRARTDWRDSSRDATRRYRKAG